MASLVSRFVSHSGATLELAAAVVPEIIAGFAAYLTPTQRDLLASELPEELAAAVLRPKLLAIPIEERILGPGINLGRAYELVASSCRALAEVLSIEAIEALRSSVPAGLVARSTELRDRRGCVAIDHARVRQTRELASDQRGTFRSDPPDSLTGATKLQPASSS